MSFASKVIPEPLKHREQSESDLSLDTPCTSCGDLEALSLSKHTSTSSTSSVSAVPVHLSRDSIPIPGHSSSSSTLSSSDIDNLVNEKYELLEVLGRGASAVVYRATERLSGRQVAIKDILFDSRMNDQITMAGEAVSLLALSDQEYGFAGLLELFVGAQRMYIVTRYAEGGDMLRLLAETIPGMRKTSYYSESDVAHVFKQLLQAVEVIHSKGIVHRDLKFDNLLATYREDSEDGFELMVADFGLSAPPGHVSPGKVRGGGKIKSLLKRLTSGKKSKKDDKIFYSKRSRRLLEVWGTVEYLSPEVRSSHSRGYGSQVDAWAVGCLLVEMLTGELAFPYAEQELTLTQKLGLSHRGLRRFEGLKGWREQPLSIAARELVHGLLHVDPVQRLSVAEALQHPFFAVEGEERPLVVASELLKARYNRRLQRKLREEQQSPQHP